MGNYQPLRGTVILLRLHDETSVRAEILGAGARNTITARVADCTGCFGVFSPSENSSAVLQSPV